MYAHTHAYGYIHTYIQQDLAKWKYWDSKVSAKVLDETFKQYDTDAGMYVCMYVRMCVCVV